MDFKNKRVVIMGLGLHGGGVGVAKFFAKQKAKVLIADLKTKEQLKESVEKLKGFDFEYSLGGHKKEDFENADLIVKNPDVADSSPYLEIARKNNIAVETDISLFFKYCPGYIIGITGTKGKSTTSSLIYHFLKTKYKKVFFAGNIGVSPLEFLDKIKKGDKVVLELSSFELENLNQSPQMAIITNILSDHLNRYASMSEYIEAKKNIFKNQNKKDILILNYDDEIARGFAKQAKSKVYFYSLKTKPAMNFKDFKLLGKHNQYNLLAAVSAVKLLGVSNERIRKAIKNFKGVSARQEFVKEIKGVKYFNDTTATMPDAAISAIDSFNVEFPKSRIILIAGGQDKNLDYKKFAEKVKESVCHLVLLPGTASLKIKKELVGWNKITEVFSMENAVKKAGLLAQKGDIVLLSPAAASFNIFKNEFDRGDKFINAIK